MKTWLTSDLHLFHANIIVYCGRPHESVEQMNQSIIDAWKSVVAPEDRVVVVGDLSAGLGPRRDELQSIISDLPGRKVLVRGNHDHQTNEWYVEAGFESVTDWMLEDNMLFIHKPATSMNPETLRIFERLEPELVVHGHIHDARPEISGHFNVAWDRHYRLINLEEVRNGNQADCNVG